MNERSFSRVAAALVACLPLCACGYSLVRDAALPGGGKALVVAPFTNQTAFADVGGLFAGAMRDALAAHGRLAPEGDSSSATLQGELRALHDYPSALGATGASAFHLVADVRLRIVAANGLLYEDNASAAEDYLQGIDVLGTEANRRTALRRLADKLVRDALERMELAGR